MGANARVRAAKRLRPSNFPNRSHNPIRSATFAMRVPLAERGVCGRSDGGRTRPSADAIACASGRHVLPSPSGGSTFLILRPCRAQQPPTGGTVTEDHRVPQVARSTPCPEETPAPSAATKTRCDRVPNSHDPASAPRLRMAFSLKGRAPHARAHRILRSHVPVRCPSVANRWRWNVRSTSPSRTSDGRTRGLAPDLLCRGTGAPRAVTARVARNTFFSMLHKTRVRIRCPARELYQRAVVRGTVIVSLARRSSRRTLVGHPRNRLHQLDAGRESFACLFATAPLRRKRECSLVKMAAPGDCHLPSGLLAPAQARSGPAPQDVDCARYAQSLRASTSLAGFCTTDWQVRVTRASRRIQPGPAIALQRQAGRSEVRWVKGRTG